MTTKDNVYKGLTVVSILSKRPALLAANLSFFSPLKSPSFAFNSSWRAALTAIALSFALTAAPGNYALAQELFPPSDKETTEEARQRELAKRFLVVLKRSPRLGTALDKVYGYHVGRGTLDEFTSALESQAESDNDGTAWMIVGMMNMQRGLDATAVSSLTKAETLLPDQPLPSYYLGKSLVLLGEVDQAAEAMRRAITKKPARADMLLVFKDLGRIYQRTGRNEEALSVWSELEKLFPNDPGVQEQIASILADEGAQEAALVRFEKLAAETKDRYRKVEMAIRAAQLKAKLGRRDDALSDFEKQLALVNPDSWLHRDIRGRIEEVFWSASDLDGLVGYYTKWIDSHPEDVDAMMRAARVLSTQKRTPEAKEWFENAIAKAPSDPEPRLALINALANDGDYGAAAEAMEALVAIETNDPDLIVRWGELVLSNDKLPKPARQNLAKGIWLRLLETRSDDPVTVSRIADLLRGAELPEDAIVHYRKAISLAENEPQYREYLGEYLHQLQRKEEAFKVWETIASDERESLANVVRLSEVYSTFGYAELALKKMAAACEMKPGFAERARYSELLRLSGDYDAALEQLDEAETLAEDPEEFELLIAERIENYRSMGNLGEKIDELKDQLAGADKDNAGQWRLLALYQDAARAFGAACDAIEKAAELAPNDARIWGNAAMLYERSGRFGEAVSAYRKLATIDRRFLTNYLTQIASIEMRVGNVENALAAGDELLAAAPGNSESYRFYADLCMQAGETERGLNALRRNVRSNPNDPDALENLAQTLANEFETDEAMELYWRRFDLSRDVDSRIPAIEALTELYLRTNRFPLLLDRLELTSREENKKREGTLWVAAAHQAAGDLGMARQLLEQLVREDSRDTKLLEQLVQLSRSEFDFESATDYQRRLIAIAPSDEGKYLLANLLNESGDTEGAKAMWLQLAGSRNGANDVLDSVQSMLSKQQFEAALELSEKALSSDPDNWELLAAAILAAWQSDEKEKAMAMTATAKALPNDPSELSIATQKQIAQTASRRQNPAYAQQLQMMGTPMMRMQNSSQIRAALGAVNNGYGGYGGMYGGGRPSFKPQSFGDLLTIVSAIEFFSIEDADERSKYIKDIVDKAIESEDVDTLHDAMIASGWADANSYIYNQNRSNEQQALLDKLIELKDPLAATITLASQYSTRQNATFQGTPPEPMSEEEIDEILAMAKIADSGAGQGYPTRSYITFWVIQELQRAGKEDEATDLLQSQLDNARSEMELIQAAGMMMQPLMYSNVPLPEEQSKSIISTALPVLEKAMAAAENQGSNQQYVASQLSSIMPIIFQYAEFDQTTELVEKLLRSQAARTAKLRPSQREKISQNPRMNYQLRTGGNISSVQVAFPTPTGYFDESSILPLNAYYEAAKENGKLNEAKAAIQDWNATNPDDPYLKFAFAMASASFEYWAGNTEQALKSVDAASQLSLATQFVSLLQARMKYDNGDVRGALAAIEKMRPSNQSMLVKRELTTLDLLLQLGDIDRAKRSAQKLFALRLDSDTEFKLADLMYQLGMRDMADRMMGRIRRRSGGKQQTLVQLMQRYASAGDMKPAAEIARQIIRRTQPPVGTSRTSQSMQHEQALQMLVRANEIKPLIERFEKLVQRSPKSRNLTDRLAAMYEASGRRSDAQALRTKAAKAAPNRPADLMAAARQLELAGKADEAIQTYIDAFRKNPQSLERGYNQARTLFQKEKAFPKLAEMIAEVGVTKFGQNNYRISYLLYDLGRAEQFEEAGKYFEAIVDGGSSYQISNAFNYMQRYPKIKVSEETVAKFASQIVDGSFSRNQNFNLISSYQSTGKVQGMGGFMANMIAKSDAQSKAVIDALQERVAKSKETLSIDHVLLALIKAKKGDFEGVASILQPVLEDDSKPATMRSQYLWTIASEISGKEQAPELAIKVLEKFVDGPESSLGVTGLQFQSQPTNLLITTLEEMGEKDKARNRLLDVLESIEIDTRQNQYNPGYGEYQFINSLQNIAERFIKLDAPAEALIAYQKSYGQPDLLAAAERYGGGRSYAQRGEQLRSKIQGAMKGEILIELIDAAIRNDLQNKSVAFLVTPTESGDSLASKRLELPIEDFLSSSNMNKEMKSQLTRVLAELKESEQTGINGHLCRLLVSNAVDDPESRKLTTDSIRSWLASSPQPTLPEPSEPASQESNDRKSLEIGDELKTKLEQELILSVVARALQTETQNADQDDASSETAPSEQDGSGNSDLAEQLLGRAINAAAALKREELNFGLQLQLASQLAVRDKARSKQLYLDALDDLYPPETEEADDRSAGSKGGSQR